VTAFLTVVHVLVCVVLIVVVLLQRGKGAEIGAVFGGGASTTVFGARGAGNFLTKITTGAVVIFFLTSLSLAYIATRDQSLFSDETALEEPAPAPEAPAAGALEEVQPAPAPAPTEAAPAPSESAPAPAGEPATP
jgi:preprotein translocase subunit SecG